MELQQLQEKLLKYYTDLGGKQENERENLKTLLDLPACRNYLITLTGTQDPDLRALLIKIFVDFGQFSGEQVESALRQLNPDGTPQSVVPDGTPESIVPYSNFHSRAKRARTRYPQTSSPLSEQVSQLVVAVDVTINSSRAQLKNAEAALEVAIAGIKTAEERHTQAARARQDAQKAVADAKRTVRDAKPSFWNADVDVTKAEKTLNSARKAEEEARKLIEVLKALLQHLNAAAAAASRAEQTASDLVETFPAASSPTHA